MRLKRARVQNYRSIIDSGEFEIDKYKTILVGPNESGKTVLLRALQQLNKPKDVDGFDILRDYPRSKYNDITTGVVDPEKVRVVTGYFELEDSDKELIPKNFHECQYKLYKNIDNKIYHFLVNAPEKIKFIDLKKDLLRIVSHMDKQYVPSESGETSLKPSDTLKLLTKDWNDNKLISGEIAKSLEGWLGDNYSYVVEGDDKEESRCDKILNLIQQNKKHDEVLEILNNRTPVFILFNNYFKVMPSVHLGHLSQRVDQKLLDDQYYDYGNLCLLKMLGFTPKELAELGNPSSPDINDDNALKLYKDKLDKRSYQLNAASVKLTGEICSAWMPDAKRAEADKLKITADGQYLKVVVEDDLGVDIELDQRSEGFQWLVSFFIVFFSEAKDKHNNAILLLDEPGMSLHGLKQREFRATISRLSKNNQTLFTTHSPFLVGPEELDIVRVVELENRNIGTIVHTTISSNDPAGLLPLQEALGYDLANSLFSQQRNLILEGITDYWYIEATSQMLRDGNLSSLNEKIALVFANSAGKVVYYATILHAHHLKVAALLDSDSAGDQAAQQENLVHALGNKNILRTKDFCKDVLKPEIEDLLRCTLVKIVSDEFGVDTTIYENNHPTRPINDLFSSKVPNFSKYKLAKAYIRWTRGHKAEDLTSAEQQQWIKLIDHINKVLK